MKCEEDMWNAHTSLGMKIALFAGIAYSGFTPAIAQETAAELRPAVQTIVEVSPNAASGDTDAARLGLTYEENALLSVIERDLERALRFALQRNRAATPAQLEGVVTASLGLVNAPDGLKRLALVRMAGAEGLDARVSEALQSVLSIMTATGRGLDAPEGQAGISLARLTKRFADSGGLNPGSPFGADGSGGGGGGPDYTAP